MASVGELFISLGFDVDETKINTFGDKIIGIRNEMGVLAGTAAAVVYGIDKFISTPIEQATALENLADLIGTTAEELQKWEFAANNANPLFSKEAAGESIKNIQDVLAAVRNGSSDAPNNSLLAILGTDSDKSRQMNALQFLTYVREHFDQILQRENQLHAGQGLQFMQKDLQAMGVATGMWQMLKESQVNFNNAMALANADAGQLENNKKLLQSINDLSNAWDNFKLKLVGDNAQQGIQFLGEFQKHVDLIKTGFEALPGIIQYGAPAIAAALTVAFSPLAAIGAVVTSILWILDEIGQFEKNGGFKQLKQDLKDMADPDIARGVRDQLNGYMRDAVDGFKGIFGAGDSKNYGEIFGPNLPKNSSIEKFKTSQVEIDRINAMGKFYAQNDKNLTDAQKSNRSAFDNEIDKFVQNNHFNVQTNQFDEQTIRTLMRESEISAHNIVQQGLGN